ncbi:bifunctional diguanylate cyclase/phosphodiesterase [Pseudorhodoferax aquiterrae]|uniref:Bifunctional diguanylate cyclase/phosphodiesterase n=1 Tax=Pseudorhodoferax aquiterrae TaxID=747304 RepID=A0ABQ3GBY4_9BURK|nr:EAL domain-containing protein [Pseudorhodoferax aquiterrae]GHD01168.1 bifunctional diguanylate cyclase/phosphodiesterase [Pseudorhodoferax aquiterrae]
MAHDASLQTLAALVVEASDNAVVVCGPDLRTLYVNPGFCRLMGYQLEDLKGKRPADVLAGPSTDLQALAAARDPERPANFRLELLLYTRAGQPLWVSITSNVVRDDQGSVQYICSMFSDITLTKVHEVLQHRVLDAMVHELPVAALMDLVCEEVERIAPELFCTVLDVDDFGRLHPLAGPSLPRALGEALDGLPIGPQTGGGGAAAWTGADVEVVDIAADPAWQGLLHLVLPQGLKACWACPVRASDGTVVGVFGLYFASCRGPSAFHRSLAGICVRLCALALERERARLRMERLASVDMLTGLANRIALKSRATQLLEELAGKGAPMAVLCLDLDRFRLVNETQGPDSGDQLLRETARRLMGCVRSIDLTGRLGGDEFAVILPSCPVRQAATAAERLLAAVAAPLVLPGATLQPTASIGVAMFPDDGTDVDTLLHHADMARTQAKLGGRGGARFFNEEMQQRTRERVALEAALRLGLRDGGLRLHYQPQIDRRSGSLYGVEALARWSHPQLGEIPPARFIPLAEEAGLVAELGRWALGEACRQMAQWRRAGIPVPRVAVNLSTRNFEEEGLVPMVAGLLDAHGLVPGDLTLEMTESMLLDATPSVLAALQALRAMGVHLSLDDFGTGYSSLSYLHRLPIHELKLDQSFVRDLADNATARALTNTILRIGDSLKLTVVAEGVENTLQAQLLAERGSTIVQGYLYGRPMPAQALADWIAGKPQQ